MKSLLRKYIKERISKIFEIDANSTQGISKMTDASSSLDPSKNYDDLKAQQLSQVEDLKKQLVQQKLEQGANIDKIKKLKVTFSQIQDTELATIKGGKSEDNKVKTMKQDAFNKEKKGMDNSIKSTEDQITKATESVKKIDAMKKQAETAKKSATTPSTPSAPISSSTP